MSVLTRLARIALLTLGAFCALPGIGALAQTSFTYAGHGNTSNAYYTFDEVPFIDQSGHAMNIEIYEGYNGYTGKPYSWAVIQSGPLEGLNLTGTGCVGPIECWKYSPFVAHKGYPYGYPFPPTCGSSCTTFTATFTGTDPNTGKTVTMTVAPELFVYHACGRGCVTDYEIYGGTVSVTE